MKKKKKRSFKKRFSEAIECDKKSMITESDKEFLKKLLDAVDKNNAEQK